MGKEPKMGKVKIWLIVLTVAIIALALVVFFVKQKTEGGEKVGFFFSGDEPVPVAQTPIVSMPTTTTAE